MLDDVTVTQTWAVWELADVDPDASTRSLFVRAMRIGRSHAASTVNTLVLAYVGATLPLMLVFSALELPFGHRGQPGDRGPGGRARPGRRARHPRRRAGHHRDRRPGCRAARPGADGVRRAVPPRLESAGRDRDRPARLVVLVSGAGTNLQALLDACADPAYGARVVAVGADRDGIEGLARADRAGVPTFVRAGRRLRHPRALGPRADRHGGGASSPTWSSRPAS